MDMEINFPGGKRVDSLVRGFTVKTDQSKEDGGENTAPSPFELFLASIGTCAGIYALNFCQKRHIDTDNLKIGLEFQKNSKTNMVERICIDVKLPPSFPAKYKPALIKSIGLCSVKKHLETPPQVQIIADVRT
ncbi:MAG: OsmC family protein [Desulfobacterales bacterium]|nr:MAG: OsmC family protein [Desulfobacterales bacterium]